MRSRASSQRGNLILLFGEDPNDTKTIKYLVQGILPNFRGAVKPLRNPPVYSRDAASHRIRTHVQRICSSIRAEQAVANVVGIIIHRDCDQIEPAHLAEAAAIERDFRNEGIEVTAVTPAWEIEAWLFLWPEAVAAFRPTWPSLQRYAGRHVGLIRNAKEEFERAVRVRGSREYRESDAQEIALKALEMGIVLTPRARSDSFQMFKQRVVRFETP